MSKIILHNEITELQKESVGHLILLFSQIEWFIANVIFLSQIPSNKHVIIAKEDIAQKYLETILSLKFSQKIEKLKVSGFDTSVFQQINNFRNMVAHGLLFINKDGIMVATSLAKKTEIKLNDNEIKKNINLLEIEGGKLLEFLKSKGYEISK